VVGGAVVGSAVAGNKNKAAAEQAQQQREEDEQRQSAEAAAQQPAVEPQPTMEEKLATVAKLAEPHKAGTLTDEEFAQQKAQILGS